MPTLLKPKQTKAPTSSRSLSLPGLVVSPYHQAGWGAIKTTMNVDAIVTQIQNDYYGNLYVSFAFYDTSYNYLGITTVPMSISSIVMNGLNSTVDALIAAAAVTNSYTVLGIFWSVAQAIPVGPTSYQTIVSQTGTSAPTSNITPINGYPSGTTFTWARTGAGVYTLTASTAVFSTTKTAVFISPLTNLNAQARGVVTSTTVVTFTTAIGSLLGLGLLGFTATNTDALLSNTMVYVQTYA